MMNLFVLVRSSSTEPPSVGDAEPGPVYIEKEGRSRGYGEALSSSNVPMESLALTSKQRRDKLSNKGQQDEEEERGTIISSFLPFQSSLNSFVEIIKVYDGNATYRNNTPRSISVPKQASYTQILVCFSHVIKLFDHLSLSRFSFQEAALRTFHINDDCTKYCITVPTDECKFTLEKISSCFFSFSWWRSTTR